MKSKNEMLFFIFSCIKHAFTYQKINGMNERSIYEINKYKLTT